jgi:hypothetical protein
MFWSASDLEELKGTSVVGLSVHVEVNRASFKGCDSGKIGKEAAEKDYYKKLLPAIQVSTTLCLR